jgi:hypothetical protein
MYPNKLASGGERASFLTKRSIWASPMVCSGYEHFGIVAASAHEVDTLWERLKNDQRDLHLETITKDDNGFRSFRVRYLLPLAVEVQFFPPSS